MSSIAYDIASAARAATPAKAPARTRKSWLVRLIEGRRRQAEEELRRHAILLPRELEQAGWKISERSEDSLPFRK